MTAEYTNPLFRVDDRLLHGSVVVGWGETLPVAEFLLADDQICADDLARELCLTCIPPDKQGQVLPLQEAVHQLQSRITQDMLMVVIRSCTEAWALYQAGICFTRLNLGGIHFQAGSRKLLPYIFLTAEDEENLGLLTAAGVEIYCQDLPGNHCYPLEELLHG
ncbi:MAG: PTS sugar transporter subunit IIB [Candidatus Delongbacteria bacterium]|nr:PTS sugar transporter subunit IIB [Candidatus Delongbacteria bacterium]